MKFLVVVKVAGQVTAEVAIVVIAKVVAKVAAKVMLKVVAEVAAEIKFMFSKKATKIVKIFTVNLMLTTQHQIEGQDFVNFCSLLRKHKV